MRAELLEKGTGFQADDFSLQVFVCGYVAILLSLFLTFPYFDFVNNSKMSVLCLFTLSMLKFQIFLYCLLYTSPSPRDLSTSRMPSSA